MNEPKKMPELKNDDWFVSLKNEKLDIGFGVPLMQDDTEHQKIYGLVVDEVNKIINARRITNANS